MQCTVLNALFCSAFYHQTCRQRNTDTFIHVIEKKETNALAFTTP